MIEWCKRFFENKLDWGHIIFIKKVETNKKTKPFTFKNGELFRMGQHNKLRRCLTTTKTHMSWPSPWACDQSKGL